MSDFESLLSDKSLKQTIHKYRFLIDNELGFVIFCFSKVSPLKIRLAALTHHKFFANLCPDFQEILIDEYN